MGLANEAPEHFEDNHSERAAEKYGDSVYNAFDNACKDFAVFGALLRSLAQWCQLGKKVTQRKVLLC